MLTRRSWSGGATAYLVAGIDPYIIQRGAGGAAGASPHTWTSTSHVQHAMSSLAAIDTSAQHINPDAVRVDLDSVRW